MAAAARVMYAECTVLNGPAKFKVSVDYDCEAK